MKIRRTIARRSRPVSHSTKRREERITKHIFKTVSPSLTLLLRIILAPPRLVPQYFIGMSYGGEILVRRLFFGLRCLRGELIGMMLQGKFAIGYFDLLSGGVGGDAENFVRVGRIEIWLERLVAPII